MGEDGSVVIRTQIDTSGLKDYTAEIKRLQTEANRTDKAIEKMRQRMGKHLELGGSASDNAYTKMQYDLAQLEIKQADYADKLSATKAAYNEAASASTESTQGQKKALEGVEEGMEKVGKAAEKNSKKISRSFSAGLGKILLYSVGVHSLYTVISKARQAVKDTFTEYAKQSSSFNAAMTSMQTSLTNLKYAVGMAIAPLAEALMPVIAQVANLVADAAYNVQALFAALTGKGTVTKINATAKAVSGVGSAVEKSLASYDKLEVINGSGSGGSGSGGGAGGGIGGDGTLFETANIGESKVGEFFDTIVERIADGEEELSAYEKVVDFVSEGIGTIVETSETLSEEYEESKKKGHGLFEFLAETTVGTFKEVPNIVKKYGKKAAEIAVEYGKKAGEEIIETATDLYGIGSKNEYTLGNLIAWSIYGDDFFNDKEAVTGTVTRYQVYKNAVEKRISQIETDYLDQRRERLGSDAIELYKLLAKYAEEGGDVGAFSYINAYNLPFIVQKDGPYAYLRWISASEDPLKTEAQKQGELFSTSLANGVNGSMNKVRAALSLISNNIKQTLEEAGNATTGFWQTFAEKSMSKATEVTNSISSAVEAARNKIKEAIEKTVLPDVVTGAAVPSNAEAKVAQAEAKMQEALTAAREAVTVVQISGKTVGSSVRADNAKFNKVLGV